MRWRMTLWLIAMLAVATSARVLGEVGDDTLIVNGNENLADPGNPTDSGTKDASDTNEPGDSNESGDINESGDTNEPGDTHETGETNEPGDTDETGDNNETGNTNETGNSKEDKVPDGGRGGNDDPAADPPETTTDGTTEPPETTTDGTPEPPETTTDGTTEPPETTTDGFTTEGEIGDDGEDSNDELIIDTYSGKIQGFPWHRNKKITGYFDIPYGVFRKPLQAATPAENWCVTHNVRHHEKRCPQLLQDEDYHEDLDCLTLSIFKPVNAANASILFHIHDDLITGSGNPSIYGPDYLVSNGIILVLPNYRIGPLGFLCMHNTTIGNAALKDLNLALSWIHRNIRHFGGDPNKIAVSGEGKSGALAGFLALSPMSKGKVNKVIAESGSFLSHLSLDRHPNDTATTLWNKIKENSNEESKNDISFETLSASEIVIASRSMEFKPCLESKGNNTFMIESPFKILSPEEDETKEKIEISFLIGSAMFAGTHEAVSQTDDSIKYLNEDYDRLLPNDLRFNSSQLKKNAGNAVKAQYFGDEPIQATDVNKISLYFTDMAYLGPGIRSARLLVAAGATVYFYEFAYSGKFNRELISLDGPVEGAVRGDIIGYLFTQDDDLPTEEDVSEREMVGTLTLMWTNFLKTGSPSTTSVEWDKLEAEEHENEEWLLIDNEPKMKKGVHRDRLKLWTNIYYYHFVDNRSHKLSPSLYVTGIQLTIWLAFCRGVKKMF